MTRAAVPLVIAAACLMAPPPRAAERIRRPAPARPPAEKPAETPTPEFPPEQYASLADCPFEPGCPALILLDATDLDNTFEHWRFLHRRVIKLFTQRGVEEHTDLTIRNISPLWTIASPTGRTILPDGTVIPLPRENVLVKPALRAYGREWVRETSMKFAGVVPGAIVEASWTELSNHPASVAKFLWEVQHDLPALRCELKVRRGDMPFEGLDRGLTRFKVNFTNPKGEARFVASNVPSLEREPESPPPHLLRFGVYFYLPALEKEWMGEVSGVAAGAAGDFVEKAPGVAARVASLTEPDDPPLTKAEKLYRFVQEKVATEEGRPEAPAGKKPPKVVRADDVLERGYGSDVERTLLYLAMAKGAGLDARLLVVSERGHAILDRKLPDPDQFNAFAAAVRIGAGWIYLDPGTKHCPFGMVAPEKELPGANALLVAPRKGAGATRDVMLAGFPFVRHEVEPYSLVSIPVSSADRNVLNRDADVTLRPDGSAAVAVTETGTGLVDLDCRSEYELLDDEGRRAALARRVEAMHPRARLETFAFEDLASFDEPATLKYRFTIDGLVTSLGDRLVLSPSVFDGWGPHAFTSETRAASVVFPHTRRTRERVVIHVPEGYEARQLPERRVLQEGPLHLASWFSRESDTIVLTRVESFDTVVWPAAEYGRLRKFFLDAREVDRSPLVLDRSGR